MKKVLLLLACLLYLQAKTYVVVVDRNSPISTISKMKLKMLYLKKIQMLDDMVMIPINLHPNQKARLSFEKHILNKSREELNYFWIKQHYLGKRPPIVLESSRSAILFVAKIKGSIAYIPKEYLTDDVKVIYSWDDNEDF